MSSWTIESCDMTVNSGGGGGGFGGGGGGDGDPGGQD